MKQMIVAEIHGMNLRTGKPFVRTISETTSRKRLEAIFGGVRVDKLVTFSGTSRQKQVQVEELFTGRKAPSDLD